MIDDITSDGNYSLMEKALTSLGWPGEEEPYLFSISIEW